jgi:hypothetical protein
VNFIMFYHVLIMCFVFIILINQLLANIILKVHFLLIIYYLFIAIKGLLLYFNQNYYINLIITMIKCLVLIISYLLYLYFLYLYFLYLYFLYLWFI